MKNEFSTKILSDSAIETAASLIKNGDVVGLPSETVYGLGADATNAKAVAKIFAAKGRPADNPLIIHISHIEMLATVARDIPSLAFTLAEKFWGGPLTLVLKKRSIIPDITSGGLGTVGVRMPSCGLFRQVIDLAGVPVAAPSANVSGSPSPTSAKHVLRDLDGKIPAIVDGGECGIGIESTVVSFDTPEKLRILRPGFVTFEELDAICETVIDESVLCKTDISQAASPGMKYTHYSPAASVVLVDGSFEEFTRFFGENSGADKYALITDDQTADFPYPHYAMGDGSDKDWAQRLFKAFRELDEIGAVAIYMRIPAKNGVGLAVWNRMFKAAGFEVIKL